MAAHYAFDAQSNHSTDELYESFRALSEGSYHSGSDTGLLGAQGTLEGETYSFDYLGGDGGVPYGALLHDAGLKLPAYESAPVFDALGRSTSSSLSSVSSPGFPYAQAPTQPTFQPRHSPSLSPQVPQPEIPTPYANFNTQYSNPSSSFQAGSHFRLHPSKQGGSSQYPPNFVPANSLSPPESNASATSWHGPSSAVPYVDNETVARMIAEAQAQGQQQAQPQYYGAIPMVSDKRSPPAAQYGMQQPMYVQQAQDPALFNNYKSTAPVSDFLGNSTLPDPSFDPLDSKRRKTSGAGVRSVSGSKVGTRSTKAVRKMSSSPPLAAVQQQPMVLNATMGAFDFALKTNVAPGLTSGASIGSGRSVAVDLIANAGIQDTRQRYQGAPSNQSQVPRTMQPLRPGPVELMPKNARVVSDKKDKAPKKGEKRKKGEKGHNAVERRYRNNINNHIATLRDIVPALRHLKPLPSMPASRRRASQFTLSTAAQAPTPAGLIDGIPAAKTLSKGTILGKSIEYIQFLQGVRQDGEEDVGIFFAVVRELLNTGGEAVIDAYNRRRAVRESERVEERKMVRLEQDELDREEDGSDVEEEEDEVEVEAAPQLSIPQTRVTQPQPMQHPVSTTLSQLEGLAQLRQVLAADPSTYKRTTAGKFPPSPVSSNDDSLLSPRTLLAQQQQLFREQHHAQGPPRILLAAFMGISFAGGLGYDWTYNNVIQDPASSGSKAWAGALIKRAGAEAFIPLPSSGLISSSVVHPSVLNGLVFLGVATVLASLAFLLSPLFATPTKSTPAATSSRHADRQQRRDDALNSLKSLHLSNANVVTYAKERGASLLARKALLKLVGAPSLALVLALAKELLATALHSLVSLRLSTFDSWTEDDRIEAAVAWVRIAEIEVTVGADEVSYLARCYTFLRLYNLSRSSKWPQSTSSTSLPAVHALLAIQLASLGEPVTAHPLWDQAASADRKRTDVVLDHHVEIAISTDFDRVKAILAVPRASHAHSERSDTLPLLRVSEARCEAALRETWAKIFVAVVQTTCATSEEVDSFEAIVDQDLLVETIDHILVSTVEGSAIHSMAKITKALCCYYTGELPLARSIALSLAHDAKTDGPVVRLGCAKAFFSLLLGDVALEIPSVEPTLELDILAATTVGWLVVKRKSQAHLASSARKVDPELHATTLSLRRLLGASVFRDAALVEFCSTSAGSASDLESAQDELSDALTDVTRVAAGLKSAKSTHGEMDSGVDVSDG